MQAQGEPVPHPLSERDGDDPVIIHAMALRPKFYRFLA